MIVQIFKPKKENRSELNFLYNWLIWISFFAKSIPSLAKQSSSYTNLGSAQLSL